MSTGKHLKTWAHHKPFRYDLDRRTFNLLVYCGQASSHRYALDGQRLCEALAHFSGKDVQIGTHRTKPPQGSIGQWLLATCKRGGIMSYLGPVLIAEGFADRGSQSDRIFIRPFAA
jgi:hypothetical protein